MPIFTLTTSAHTLFTQFPNFMYQIQLADTSGWTEGYVNHFSASSHSVPWQQDKQLKQNQGTVRNSQQNLLSYHLSYYNYQFNWAPPGGAPVHDLAVVDEVRHGADDLLQGAVRVVLVDQHQVDVLHLEVPQGLLHRLDDLLPGERAVLSPETAIFTF